MDNSIYEVERDEYAGFIGQLNKSMMDVEQYYENNITIMKIKSQTTGKLLCTRVIPDDEPEHYFIFNMPEPEESIPPKAIMKVILDNREDVQNFFNALNKIQQEQKS